MTTTYDYTILGGGIVGLATAWQLQQRYPDKHILLIEKESSYAQHQTGHNSGVIHAGVYYVPGSLKAEFCRQGAEATMAFCQQHGIAYEQCGKLLVATNKIEYERMQALYQRCQENDIDVEWLDAIALKKREPNVVGIAALFVPSTGIVNYRQVCEKMAALFIEQGGQVALNHEVVALNEQPDAITITAQHDHQQRHYRSEFLIACCGLMADRVAAMMNLAADFQIIPYRGEYYRLPAVHNDIVNHLIYPIPDPDLPFLGVHLTRMIDGSVTVGPNAVQGFKREGYDEAFNFSLTDTAQMFGFAGFWKVSLKHLCSGLAETKDAWYKPGYLKRVQKYCPQINLSDLLPYPAGVRAQAVLANGELVHDFLFVDSPRSLHVCNAPSPAATSAMPIGGYICDKVAEKTQRLALTNLNS